jgi:hypothetical protein
MIPLVSWTIFALDVFIDGSGGEKFDKLNMKQYVIYLNCAKSFMFLLTTFITISERNKLMKEINTTLYSVVDESLTQDLYNNIIEQSKHPNDYKLYAEFKRLTKDRVSRINNTSKHERKSNNTFPLDESSLSGNSGLVNKVGGSINFNPEKTLNSKDITSK